MKTRKEVDATLGALLDNGVIEAVERKGQAAGRPAKAYRLTGGISLELA